jgi:hypothetical protein
MNAGSMINSTDFSLWQDILYCVNSGATSSYSLQICLVMSKTRIAGPYEQVHMDRLVLRPAEFPAASWVMAGIRSQAFVLSWIIMLEPRGRYSTHPRIQARNRPARSHLNVAPRPIFEVGPQVPLTVSTGADSFCNEKQRGWSSEDVYVHAREVGVYLVLGKHARSWNRVRLPPLYAGSGTIMYVT